MITSRVPGSWRELQDETARVLRECGFAVEVEKVVDTARGRIELDVYAEETVDGRRYSIVCECKHWRARVPQTVVHGFRAVVGDLGANLGLIVASGEFQSGAAPAAAYTNVRLVTWEAFQAEFERTWIKRFLQPTVAARCDPLLSYTEPLLPVWFDALPSPHQDEYLRLKRTHDEFGWLMMTFTPYTRALGEVPVLPLRPRITVHSPDAVIPDAVLDAEGYREFLDVALAHSDRVIAAFRALRLQAASPLDDGRPVRPAGGAAGG